MWKISFTIVLWDSNATDNLIKHVHIKVVINPNEPLTWRLLLLQNSRSCHYVVADSRQR